MINQDMFKGRQFVLDLPTNTSYREKLALKKKITTHNGIVSYIITRKTNYVVHATSDASQSYRMQIADKYGIQVVTPDFLDACLENGTLVDSNLYLAPTKLKRQQNHFSDGKIFAKSEIKSQPVRSRLLSVKTWAYKDNKGPTFHNSPYSVVKAVVLKGKQKESGYNFCIIEIHLTHGHYSEEQHNRFCVFTHQGVFSSFIDINECCKKICRFVKNSSNALHLFEQLYKLHTNPPHSMVHCNCFPNLPHLGSDHFHVEDWLLAPVLVQPKVAQFVTDIWAEALYMLASTLSVPLKSIQEMQVIHGEALLVEISNALLDGDINKADEFSKEFYKAVPHRCQNSIKTWDMLISKHDLCQMIGDMLMLQELVSISDENAIEQQYFSLHCDIQVLKVRSTEYQAITSLILDKKEDLQLTVNNIFTVRRSCEDDDFTYDIGNKRLLFHGSKIENFVGILSRGMLPSKPIGCQDTNIDNNNVLGSGLYFTDEITAAVQYAVPSHTSGRRYLLISEVALGECYNLYSYKAQLVLPPGGYNSICGVKNSAPEVTSDFEYNQYVVYQVSQQRLRYIVDFCRSGDQPMMEKCQSSVSPNILQVNPLTFFTRADFNVSTFDVGEFLLKHDRETVPAEVGLCSDTHAVVPLKSLHIRAKLIDLAAEVVVMQEYYNDSSSSIEARYVFPLDSKAAVCGFEAFSNGQHFVGRIEEKKEAHQEYKQAVESGQRAYLLDEEAPDVFKVSVGNVRPHSTVLVKIRYVAELDLEGDLISFRLPGSLCPWQHQQVLDSQNCTGDQAVDIPNSKNICTTLQLFVEMPFDIKSLFSPTHSIEVKKTMSKAVVSTDIVTNLTSRFQLLIGLSEIHIPRMWVEKHPDMDSTACMLTFYPEFVTDAKDNVEVILALDASNSMYGTSFAAAKQVAILCLHYLPPEAKFNVLMFGTTYYEIFPRPQKKSLENVHDAQKSILECKPSFGSSRIDHFLQSYFNLIPHEGTLRNIFVITDGHLQHVDRVLSKAEKQNRHTRLFTLGVGPFVNSHLLNRLSHAGGGTYQCFDDNRQSQWVAKLKDQMLKVEEPVLTDVRVEWQQFNADDSLLQAPQQLNSVFSGSRLTVYGFVSNCSLATLKAFVMGTEITTTVFTSKLTESNGTILHGLTTKAIVRDWENGSFNEDRVLHEVQKRALNTKIIELSKQFSIITPLTSFVSVENKDNNKTEGLSSCPTIGELVYDEDVDFLKYIQSHTEISQDTTAEELWELGAEESGCEVNNKIGNEKHEYLLKINQHPSIFNSEIQNHPTTNATKLFKNKSRKEIINHSDMTLLGIKSKPTITDSLEEVVEPEPENNSLTTTSYNVTNGTDRPRPVIAHKHLKPFLCLVEDSVDMETESEINFNVVSKTKNCDFFLPQEVVDEQSTTSYNQKMNTATLFPTSSPVYIPTSPSYAPSTPLPPVHPSTVLSTTSPEYIPTSPSYALSSPLLPVHPSTVFSTATSTFGFNSFSNSNPAATKQSSSMFASNPAAMSKPMSLNSSTQQQQTQAQLPQHVPSNSIATNFSFGGYNLESDSELMKIPSAMAKDHIALLCTTPAFAPNTNSQVHPSNVLSHSLFSSNKGTLGAFAAGNQTVSLQTSNSLYSGLGSTISFSNPGPKLLQCSQECRSISTTDLGGNCSLSGNPARTSVSSSNAYQFNSLQTAPFTPKNAIMSSFGSSCHALQEPLLLTTTCASSANTSQSPSLQTTGYTPKDSGMDGFGDSANTSLIPSLQTFAVTSENTGLDGFGFGASTTQAPSLQTTASAASVVKETFGFGAKPYPIPSSQTATVTAKNAVVGGFAFGLGSTKAPSLQTTLCAPSAVKETFGFGATPCPIPSTQTATVTSKNAVVGRFSFGGGTTQPFSMQTTASAPSVVKETFGFGANPIPSSQTGTVTSKNAVEGGFAFGAGSTKAPSLQTTASAPSAVKETFGFGANPIPSSETVTSKNAVVGGFSFGGGTTQPFSLQTTASAPSAVKETFGFGANPIPSSQTATVTSKNAGVGGFPFGGCSTQRFSLQTTASAPSAVKETFGFGANPIPSSQTATVTSKNAVVGGFAFGLGSTKAPSLQTTLYAPSAVKEMFRFHANTSLIPSLQTDVDTPKDVGFGGFGSRTNAPQVHSLQTTVHATNNATVGFTPPSGFSELGCFRFPQESYSKSGLFGSPPSRSSTRLFGSAAYGQPFFLQKAANVSQFPITEITATQYKPVGLPQQLQMDRSADVHTQKSAGGSVPGSTNSDISFGSNSFQVPSVHSLVGAQKNPDVGTAPVSMFSEVGSFESQQLFQSKLTPNTFPPGYSMFGSNSAKLSCQTATGVAQFPGVELTATRAKLLGLPQQAIPGRSTNSDFQSSASGSLFGSANFGSVDRNQSLFKMPVGVLQANSSTSETPLPPNDPLHSVSDTQQHSNPGSLLHLPSNAIKTLALSDSCKSESVSLGSGLPFFSALFKRLVFADFAFMTPQQIGVKVNERLSKLTNPRVKESIFCALDYCNSTGAIRHSNLPSKWNHHLWHSIQIKLADNGLNSMGSLVHDVILDLIATIAVLFAICRKLFPGIFPLNLNSPTGIVKQGNILANVLRVCVTEKRLLSFILCLVYITTVNQRHPLVYRTLELGSSWEEAYFNLTGGALLFEI